MRPLYRVVAPTIILASALVSTVGCATSGGGSADAEGTPLRVGIAPDYPPVVYEEDDSVFGFEADNAHGVGERLGREIEFVKMPFKELIPTLQAGDIDVIMSGMTITKERSEDVWFCKPYLTVGLSVLVKKGNAGKYADAEELRKAQITIGAKEGTTGHEYAERLCWGKKNIVFADHDTVVPQLEKDDVDVYIRDTPVIKWIASANSDALEFLDFGLMPQKLAWAVRHGDKRLRKELNRTVKAWRKSGRLEATTQRWLPGWDGEKSSLSGLRSMVAINVRAVDAPPNTKIQFKIDDEIVRTSDFTLPRWHFFYMDPGEHTYELSAKGYKSQSGTTTLEPGNTGWHTVTLKK
jgi:ABC-type amino acid transport substrate-binding protein